MNFDITNVYLLLLSKKKKISWLSLYSNYTCTVSYKIVYSTLSSRQTNLSSSKVYTSGAIFNWNCPYFWYWGKVLSTLAMKCVFLQDKHMKSTLYMGYISAQYKALSSWIYKHIGCDIQIYVLPVVQKRNVVFGFEICVFRRQTLV